jgi:hypothetical protein
MFEKDVLPLWPAILVGVFAVVGQIVAGIMNHYRETRAFGRTYRLERLREIRRLYEDVIVLVGQITTDPGGNMQGDDVKKINRSIVQLKLDAPTLVIDNLTKIMLVVTRLGVEVKSAESPSQLETLLQKYQSAVGNLQHQLEDAMAKHLRDLERRL